MLISIWQYAGEMKCGPLYRINHKALTIKLAVNVAPWFMAAFAVFYVKVYLYSIVAILNLVLGCLILFFHVSGNPTVIIV